MKKWLWIGLLMGLIACGSSSNGEENTDTTSPSDSVSNDDTSNSRGDDRVDARSGAPVVSTGFERDI